MPRFSIRLLLFLMTATPVALAFCEGISRTTHAPRHGLMASASRASTTVWRPVHDYAAYAAHAAVECSLLVPYALAAGALRPAAGWWWIVSVAVAYVLRWVTWVAPAYADAPAMGAYALGLGLLAWVPAALLVTASFWAGWRVVPERVRESRWAKSTPGSLAWGVLLSLWFIATVATIKRGVVPWGW